MSIAEDCWLIEIYRQNWHLQEKVRSAAVSGNLDAPEGNIWIRKKKILKRIDNVGFMELPRGY